MNCGKQSYDHASKHHVTHRKGDGLNGLDLFSGIGGISLALEPWVRTIAYCEQDRYAQGVLMSRMREGLLDRAPIWPDVRTLSAMQFTSPVDIIFGGFPCQDISVAGTGKGLEGERSGLFFEIIRLVNELRPQFIFLENVPAITVRGLDRVVGSITELGYDCRWTIVSAAELGAPHLRKRWFMLASDANSIGSGDERQAMVRRDAIMDQCTTESRNDGEKELMANTDCANGSKLSEAPRRNVQWQSKAGQFGNDGQIQSLANADGERLEKSWRKECGPTSSTSNPGWWAIEPDVGRVVNGLSFRVDRLRCLGNAVVPIQAREAFKRLSGIE